MVHYMASSSACTCTPNAYIYVVQVELPFMYRHARTIPKSQPDFPEAVERLAVVLEVLDVAVHERFLINE